MLRVRSASDVFYEVVVGGCLLVLWLAAAGCFFFCFVRVVVFVFVLLRAPLDSRLAALSFLALHALRTSTGFKNLCIEQFFISFYL